MTRGKLRPSRDNGVLERETTPPELGFLLCYIKDKKRNPSLIFLYLISRVVDERSETAILGLPVRDNDLLYESLAFFNSFLTEKLVL